MEIRVHPASSLYPGPELIPAVLDGRSEVGTVLASYLTDVLLEMGAARAALHDVEHRRSTRRRRMQLRPFYTEMLAKKGLKLLVHQHLAVAADLLHRAHPHRGRLEGQEDPRVRRRLRQRHAPPRRVARQHRLRRGVLRAREEDGGRRHDLRHQRRAHEVLRGGEVSSTTGTWPAPPRSGWWPTRRRGTRSPRISSRSVLDSIKETNLEEKEWADAAAADERTRKRLPELGMTVVDPPRTSWRRRARSPRPPGTPGSSARGADGKRGMDLALKALGR